MPEGERSSFIRDAIFEKLEKTPRPNKIFELEQKLNQLKKDINTIKSSLAKLELLTHEPGKVNPHIFCIDGIDTELINYFIDHRGATTTELAKILQTNRWLILSRLRKIENASKRQLGQAIIKYYPGERLGKRKAWWIQEDLIET